MKALELIRPQKNELSLVGEFTFFCDKYTVLDEDYMKETRQYAGFCTYVLEPSCGRENLMAIRFPGATRGHIEIDENKVIKDIVFYPDSGIEGPEDNNVGIYKQEIIEATRQFIGRQILVK